MPTVTAQEKKEGGLVEDRITLAVEAPIVLIKSMTHKQWQTGKVLEEIFLNHTCFLKIIKAE
jgi:hypothetical protein